MTAAAAAARACYQSDALPGVDRVYRPGRLDRLLGASWRLSEAEVALDDSPSSRRAAAEMRWRLTWADK